MKRFSIKKLGKQYIKYLITDILVFLIPVCVLTVFSVSRFFEEYKNEVYETVSLELEQSVLEVNNEIGRMQSIVHQLPLLPSYRNFDQTMLSYQLLIDSLSVFKETNNFEEELFLIPDDGDFVVSNTSTCDRDYFYNHLFTADGVSAEKMQAFIEKTPLNTATPVKLTRSLSSPVNGKDYILFLFPIYSDYEKHQGAMLFVVRAERITKMLSERLSRYNPYIEICKNDIILARYGTEPDNNSQFRRWNCKSAETGYSITVAISEGQRTFLKIEKIRNEYYILISIILLFSTAAIILLQNLNYAPIKKLNKAARTISGEENRNEVETIENAMTLLKTENTKLQDRMEKSLTDIKNKRLSMLLSGRYENREAFDMDTLELDLVFPFNHYLVSIIEFEQCDADFEALIEFTVTTLSESSVCHYVTGAERGRLIVIQNLPKGHYDNSIFSGLQKAYEDKFKTKATISVGSLESAFENISVSFMNADAGLDYRFIKGTGSLILPGESRGETSIDYPYNEFARLKNALLIGDEEAADIQLKAILEVLNTKDIPLSLAICISQNLFSLTDSCGSSRKLLQVEEPSSVDQVCLLMKEWYETYKEENRNPRLSHSGFTIDDVNKYLNENCLRCSFSILEAAENFDMSLPVFSKYYKDTTGSNVMDYMLERRMEEAKRLLRETDLLLKDIAEMVGYYNVSSFLRRFKILEGITPSDYRKLYTSSRGRG